MVSLFCENSMLLMCEKYEKKTEKNTLDFFYFRPEEATIDRSIDR